MANDNMQKNMDNHAVLTRSLAAVWHPCTQMKQHETLPLVPIARGDGVSSGGISVKDSPVGFIVDATRPRRNVTIFL